MVRSRTKRSPTRAEAAALREQAKAAGAKWFFTGLPCKHGHIAERYVDGGGCVACHNALILARDKAAPANLAARKRRWKDKNPEKVRSHRVRWQEANPEKYAASQRKTAQRLERRLATRLRIRISNLLRGKPKTGSAVSDLGCTVAELIAHLESKFGAGMAWENYGTEWEIDHIRELVSFDLLDQEQFRQAAHYTNLQPLFRADHIEKTRTENARRRVTR